MKILLRDFNAKVGKEDILNRQFGMKVLHEISNDNGVRLVNVSASKNSEPKVRYHCYELHTTFYRISSSQC
jgi:hypothetical protein